MADEQQTPEDYYRAALKQAWDNFNSISSTGEEHASAYTRAFAKTCADDIRRILASAPTEERRPSD